MTSKAFLWISSYTILVLNWELPDPPDGGSPGAFVDESEPNEFDDPDPLEIGQTARGTIDPEFDGDVWRFEGMAGQAIVINVEAEARDPRWTPSSSSIWTWISMGTDSQRLCRRE